MRTKSMISHQNTPELYRSFVMELDLCHNQLAKLILSPARDLDNLSSYLTASISPVASYNLPQTPPSPSEPISEDIWKPNADVASPTITVDSSEMSNHEIRTVNDLSHFKFGPSIVLAYPCDMIASNGRTILSYVIERNFLNYSTVVGVHLSSVKVYRLLAPITATNARLWDIVWCTWSNSYLM